MHKTEKYRYIFALAALHNLKSYKALIGMALFLLTCLLAFANLWQIAAAKVGAAHLKPQQLLWYIAFNEWVLISIPDVQIDMEQDLRSGKLAYLLPRPISYLASVFFEGLGKLIVHLFTLGLIAFLFAALATGSFPFNYVSFTLILFVAILAGILGIVLQMLVGLSAFWLQDVAPVNWILEKLLFALGGLILPLSLYPVWIQKIAYFTPFPAILGERSALAIEFNFHSVAALTGNLLLWICLSTIGLCLLYRRGLRILTIEGG